MSNDPSDLSAALAGDQQAFARLYERHAGVVLSLCRRCSSMAEAEDAMQETFIRAYRKLDQLDHSSGFRCWLYAIAKRVCAESKRSAARRNRRETQAAVNRSTSKARSLTAGEALEQAEQLDRLTEAINMLPDKERLAIHLYYLDPDPNQAAASVLGLSRSGFYKLLTRARKLLASYMRETKTI